MKLDWSIHALADRDDIFDHIEADSPRAAIAMDEIISRQVSRLTRFPESGRIGRVEGTRELVINRTSYLAVYRISDEAVQILRILHGARLWPDDAPD